MAVAMRLLHLPLAWLLALVFVHASAQDFVAVPPLSALVTDTIGMLNAQQKLALENTLKEYESRTGSQIVVLLIAKTEPEAIEQYGIRVAEAWQVGRKGIDDGAILIVARDNPKALRRLRIEAGRGVQGTLTDAQSKRILQDVIAPHFRQNDFYGGLTAGTSAIMSLLDQEHIPAPTKAKQTNGETEDTLAGMLPFLFFSFIIIVAMARSRGGARRGLNSNGWGRGSGIILGSAIGDALGRGGFGSSGGGFSGGGGGFSGGGGTFDGGGASGDW